MTNDNLQESLQPFATVLNDIVGEPIREDLPGQWGYSDARGLPFQYVAEVFKVAVSTPDARSFEL